MAIQSVQLNTPSKTDSAQNRTVNSYLAADKPISTDKKVKPLPPQGHLVDDNLISGTKYFFKDIGYDMKSLKNGVNGSANDHQLGRLNDVGLRLGGICIATYLATQTTNPKARLMEYIGLAMFLTSMAIYPKIAINTPARIVHGYDIDKEYIDDQGRKKSVHQDSNYIPYDMYNGKNAGEDLDIIGDRMGIPRDIKNRHDVIREQMRKIATQNNTLWMLTAGLATPLMTALLCCGIEKFIVSPGLEKSRNKMYNSKIRNLLSQLDSEKPDYNTINNSLGDSVKRIISKFEGKSIPKDEVESLKELLTSETDVILSDGIKTDIEKLLSDNYSVKLDKKSLNSVFENASKTIRGRQSQFMLENILPSQPEIEGMINSIKPNTDLAKGVELSKSEFELLESKINEYINRNTENINGEALNHKDYIKSNAKSFQDAFIFEKNTVLTKESSDEIIKFANILGDFKKNMAVLDKCENFKFEYAPESILANYYEKFQKMLFKQLDISPKYFKRISNDTEFTQKILNEKFLELSQNEVKYQQTFEKLGKILSDMESALNSAGENESYIKDLINGIETVYHNTADALKENGIGKVTSNRLTKGENAMILSTNEKLYRFLNGVAELPKFGLNGNSVDTLLKYANGKGSSKNLKISRLVNRYQGEMDSFLRVLHTLDFYKTALNPETILNRAEYKDKTYLTKLEQDIKTALLNGSISDFILKHGIENVNEYRDFYNVGWALESENYGKLTQKGELTAQTKESLSNAGNGSILERLQTYITRLKNTMSNDTTDFTRPNHVLNNNVPNIYRDTSRTNEAKFNLVAQSPVDMVQKAAGKMHADRMWLKTVGIITAAVFGVALSAQFAFGKIMNKHTLQKIDNDNKKRELTANA